MEQPNIMFEGKKYFIIGCRKCGNTWGENTARWDIATDGINYIAKCKDCGHIINVSPTTLVKKPDVQAIPLSRLI